MEVEEVLTDPGNVTTASESSGQPITFGWTSTGIYIAVVWERVDEDPLVIYPITAYCVSGAKSSEETTMKNGKGEPRKKWSAEDKKRHAKIRERFQRDKPTLEELRARRECGPPIPLGDFLSLGEAVAALKRERERKGMSLADVAKRSKIDKAALSRLENGLQINPTVGTLRRYAAAVDAKLVYSVKPGEDVSKQ